MLSISEAAAVMGVSANTLRRWEREGKFPPPARTPGNHRRYRVCDLASFYTEQHGTTITPLKKKAVCYARVSGHDQIRDLDTQADKLAKWCKEQNYQNIEILKDLGSGLNFHKRGLQRLLHLIMTYQIDLLLINHRDRLLRFGNDLIFAICAYMGVKVVILDEQKETISDEEQLSRDVIQIMTVFCAKLHGKRAHKNKTHHPKKQVA